MKKGNKLLFLSHFIKKAYFIPMLFFAGVFITLLMANLHFGFISVMQSNMKWFTVCCLSYFGVLFLLYIFSNVKNKSISISDSLAFAIVITCVFYLIYVMVFLHNFNIARIATFAGILLATIISIVYRVSKYQPDERQKNITYNKSNLNGYFHSLSRHFTFFGIIVFALVITCLFLILTEPKPTPHNYVDSQRYVQHIVLLSILLLFLIVSASFRKITLLDAGLVSGILTIPPALTYILLVASSTARPSLLRYFLIAVCFIVFLIIIRLLSFSVFKPEKETDIADMQPSYKNFFNRYTKKFGWFLTVAAACATALLIVFLSYYWNFERYIANGRLDFRVLFVFVPVALLFSTLCVGLFLSIVNFKAKDVTYGDFFTVFNIFFAIAGIVAFNNTIATFEVYAMLGIIVYSLTILVARFKIISKKN